MAKKVLGAEKGGEDKQYLCRKVETEQTRDASEIKMEHQVSLV